MAQPNQVTIEGKVFSDAESRDFQNGGSIVSFQIGFLESSYWSKDQDKMIYKNGFIRCKKNLSDKSSEALVEAIKGVRKGDRLLIVGHLGFEEWEDRSTQKKRSQILLIIDNFYNLSGSGSGSGRGDREEREERQETRSSSRQSPSRRQRDTEPDDEPEQDDKDEIPF